MENKTINKQKIEDNQQWQNDNQFWMKDQMVACMCQNFADNEMIIIIIIIIQDTTLLVKQLLSERARERGMRDT